MIHRKNLKKFSICLVWLLIMCLCVSCTSDETPDNILESPAADSLPPESLPVQETVPVTELPDTEGPVISGAQDLTAPAGGSLSYRNGVTAKDDRDGDVALQVDSSGVDLNTPGEYHVIYSAQDSSGNRTEVIITVVITEPEGPVPEATRPGSTNISSSSSSSPSSSSSRPGAKTPTLADVEAQADKVLAQITTPGMSQLEKARAIFNYVNRHIKYVGTSDKSSWIVGAYVGFTTGRGDCFNYFACSKALLTRAGIPNVDLHRVGGPTRHYWQLVNVGNGYYHFDACPHDRAYPLVSFMLTEDQARAYTALRGKNYYVYDYASCPVPVVGLSESERNPHGTTTPAPTPELPEHPTPQVTPEPTPELPESPTPTPEVTPEPTPELPEDPTPEVTPDFSTGPAPEATPEPDPAPEPMTQPEGQEG